MNRVKGFFKKCGSWLKKSTNKIAMLAGAPVMALAAEEGVSPLSETGVDASSLVESIKGFFADFTVANLVTIIGGALALAVVLFLFWFAYRFIKRAVVKAITKGKI